MSEKNRQNKKLRLIFMGTPDFAVPGLLNLATQPEFKIVGVYTQTDKPVGRKQILTPPPIKVAALKNNLTVFQPLKIKAEFETIKSLKPDLIIVIAYGKIIPQEILDIPTYGCINIHASLLPKYRGAACLNAPILNGDSETGVTIMKMDAGLDTGPILRQSKIQLSDQENLEDVHDKLSILGSELLIPTLQDFLSGKIDLKKQTEENASYVKTLKKEDGKIDWHRGAKEIERMIRAYNPWPGTYSLINKQSEANNKIIKILQADNQVSTTNKYRIGEFFIHNNQLMIQCGQDSLVILKLQIEGKKALSATDFIRGHSNLIGQTLN